jgi:hypothetical protein
MPLDRATLSFEWRFDALSNRRTRLTQHILLSSANATAYAEPVRAAFGATLRDGMERIAATIVRAEDLARRAGHQLLKPMSGAGESEWVKQS